MTDYGLPMMTAIPGTGNGTTNPDSQWHHRPHTGWYNKYVGSGNRPRWWYYENEVDEVDDNDSLYSSSEDFKFSDKDVDSEIQSPQSFMGKRHQESTFDDFFESSGDGVEEPSPKRKRLCEF
eukprot:CAMPEP_0114509872 /NCGR_PEP_ID=MMETSP0109-20121206/13461_1 /TAXON_ID=29199 /ORGANISM="Chlorarachnion reptans, Strain CCCM449" /LENGTH=121 /DNA_ID=CAMNT_0001689093 /DNA_START=731 /DNA_END=1096 /DNA_ORIENTATION=-